MVVTSQSSSPLRCLMRRSYRLARRQAVGTRRTAHAGHGKSITTTGRDRDNAQAVIPKRGPVVSSLFEINGTDGLPWPQGCSGAQNQLLHAFRSKSRFPHTAQYTHAYGDIPRLLPCTKSSDPDMWVHTSRPRTCLIMSRPVKRISRCWCVMDRLCMRSVQP